jgi:hypothetical protein
MAGQIDNGKYATVDATIDTHLASMKHLIEESRSLGVNAELPQLAKTLADRAVAEGRGDDGYAALIEQFGRPSPVLAASGEAGRLMSINSGALMRGCAYLRKLM